MKVPYFDLKRQYKYIGSEIETNVLKSLRSTQYSLGPEVVKFENKYASFVSTNYCTGVNTGTSALHLALLACGIGVGDEVITVSMTFVASVMSISYTEPKPVFVDVFNDTQLMNFEKLEKKLLAEQRQLLLYIYMVNVQKCMRLLKLQGNIISK